MTDKPLALVTGASRGVGRAAALALAQSGFHVVAVARSQKALESLDDEIAAAGGSATFAPLDLKDFTAIDSLGAVIAQRWGRIDAVFGCAGVLGDITPIFQAKPSMMEEAFAVNAMSAYRVLRICDPLLRQSKAARVVFVTSSAAHRCRPYWGPYAASKAAMEQIVLTYAAEVAMTPIRVNLLDPGPVATAMRAKAYPGEDPTALTQPTALTPLIRKMLSPEYAATGECVRFSP